MASVGSAAAEGLRSGFQMGMQHDAAQEAKRARLLDEAQQAEVLGMRKTEMERQAARQAAQDTRQAEADAYKLDTDEHNDVVQRVAALQAAGQPIPPELQARGTAASAALRERRTKARAPQLAAERQKAVDFFTGVQAGRVDPLADDVTPAQFYRHVSLATGRTPEQIAQAAAAAQQIQEGMQFGNQELLLQGVNTLAAPDLRAGVGQPSPHGGNIVKKEIVRLIPVRDANGVEHPDKVFPVLRVWTDKQGPDGQPMYYDAPLTQNRTSDPDDPVKAVDLKHAFDYMGNLGTLAAALQDPRAAAKLAQGAKEVGEQTRADVDEINALGRAELVKHAKGSTAMALAAINNDPTLSEEQKRDARDVALGLKPKAAPPKPPSGGVQAFEARVQAIRDLGLSPEAEKAAIKDLTLRGGGKISGDVPVKGAGTGRSAGGGKPASSKFEKDPEYAKQVDTWAKILANGGDLPPGFARANKEMYSDIVARAPLLAPEGAEGMMANRAAYAGMKAGSRSVETRAANFALAKSEAYEMADLVTDASKTVSRTAFIPVNKALNAFNANSGDVATRQFGAAINSFINAYARAVSPIGAPTVSDKNHAREMLSTADSHEQVVGIIAQLKKEMVAAGNAPKVVREEQSAAVRGLGGGAKPTPSVSGPSFATEQDAMAAVKAGKVKAGDVITVGGRKMKWVD